MKGANRPAGAARARHRLGGRRLARPRRAGARGRAGLGLEGGGRVARAARAVGADPGQRGDLGPLARERGGLAEEIFLVDGARADLARDAHQLLLVLDQAQADLLLRDLGVALDRACSRSSSSLRRYQKAEMIAARKSSTDTSGPSVA